MGPDSDPFFINGEQATLAINNRAAPTKGIAAFSLGLASARFQLFTGHQLQPRQPESQAA